MRITAIRSKTVPISRYADPGIPSDGLNTTVVAILTDAQRNGQPLTGYGFTSVGRYGQQGLINERFAPRLIAASAEDLGSDGATLDPLRAWSVMMHNEKPGGHGERSVAVGALDMALWDLAAKLAGQPLAIHAAALLHRPTPAPRVRVYAGGGYVYPQDDLARWGAEVRMHLDAGHTHVKMKIASLPLAQDVARIEAALRLLPSGKHLAVDAMNRYTPEQAAASGAALSPFNLRWLEDFCDPLDYATHARMARLYPAPLAAGEALFSMADARNLARYGGLRPERDILLFDPAHCYGLTEYARLVSSLELQGWPRHAFWPHGGHLFSLHVAAALGLGGSEANPHNFQPFGGFADGTRVEAGMAAWPHAPGIGFETRAPLAQLFADLLG